MSKEIKLVGHYTMRWIDSDTIVIRRKMYDGGTHEAYMAGGDFETILATAFVGADLHVAYDKEAK